MDYNNLYDFISKKMRMSHIYQPVMIKTLICNNGELEDEKIAIELLKYDISQIEYYQNITNTMVGKVLRRHSVINKKGNKFYLEDYKILTEKQKDILIKLCNNKIEQYINKRGSFIWEHRKKSKGTISGSVKYEVLKRAKFRCELCGISAEIKALEVDHIVPKNLGGEDSINNYQALCYSCNSMKRDTDKTDFRNNYDIYNKREKDCIFCNINKNKFIIENNLSYSIFDNYPVTNYHCLIIPRRHIASYFELTQAEINSCNQILNEMKKILDKRDNNISGYNIGINDGKNAGQTIYHCHIHLIPRRKNDVNNPLGGIRHTIPGKGYY